MPNVTSVLNEQIRRLARREIKAQTKTVRKLSAQYRRAIAALKREVVVLRKSVSGMDRQQKRQTGIITAPNQLEKMRFRADGMKTHRAKIGISAKDYGKLVGVSGLTIYNWETKKAKPRRSQLGKLGAVRGIGKREALKRLESMGK